MKNVTNSSKSPYFSLIIGLLAVSTASLLIRFAQQDAPSLIIAAFRLSIASAILFVINGKKTISYIKKLSNKDILIIVLAGFFLAIHFASWITSLEYTSITSSVVLVTTTPLWVSLFSPLLLKEKISFPTIIGLLVAFTGTIIIGLSDPCDWNGRFNCPPISSILSGDSIYGNFLALIGAWTAAGYTIIGRKLRKRIPLFPYVTILYSASSIILWILVAITGASVFGYQPQTYYWMILLAIIPQLIGHSSFNWALGHLPASFVSITLLGEPIGSIILAFIFLGEVPNNITITGAIIIFLGILMPSISSILKDRKTRPLQPSN